MGGLLFSAVVRDPPNVIVPRLIGFVRLQWFIVVGRLVRQPAHGAAAGVFGGDPGPQ